MTTINQNNVSTGLFDKNNKEIFVGDIIKYNHKDEVKTLGPTIEIIFELPLIVKNFNNEFIAYLDADGGNTYFPLQKICKKSKVISKLVHNKPVPANALKF